MLKNKPYRNKKILQAAKDCPVCMMCGKPNDGTVVGAHLSGMRSHEFGKGIGQKASDSVVAYLCYQCHESMDQYHDGDGIRRSEKFLLAIVRSHDWLFRKMKSAENKTSFEKWVDGL